jgi:SAM-dependent methyltransferase
VGEIFRWERPAKGLPFTGERFTSATSGQIAIEHLHRYFLARELSRGKDVLDVAAGEGYGSAMIAQVAKSVVGVEIDAETVAHAARAYDRPNLKFTQGDARAIPLEAASVDIVVSFETIEHLYEQEVFIAEVRRVLRPDGVFIVSTPDRDVYSPTDSPANPFHVRELTVSEFERALRGQFSHVDCLLQRTMLGSALLPSRGVAATEPALTFERRGDDHFELSVGLPRAMYAVALASARPIALPAASLYIETGGIGLHLHETAQISAAKDRVEQMLTAVKSDNERLESLLSDARSECERLTSLVSLRDAEKEKLTSEFGSDNQRLEGLVKESTLENERLATLAREAKADNAKLEALLGEAKSEKQRAGSLLDEFRTTNKCLEMDLADAQAALVRTEVERVSACRCTAEALSRLHLVEGSLCWRSLAPLSRLGRRFPMFSRLARHLIGTA